MTLESIAPLSDGVPITLPHRGSLNVPALPAGMPRGAQRSYTTRRTFGANYLIKGRFFS